jgi:adenylate cyclase
VQERTEALEAEKGISDKMLENILPKAAIEELKRTGKTTAQQLDNITVLLADIKGFTNISEKLTPQELISKIDFYFRSFDEIMMKYGLEKIKTIGDAYMAAGGLDGNKETAAVNMIAAALDMQQCMRESNNDIADAEKLEMRIGIHTGTVIAGVVGTQKFQYDMWGDTVNIAARMEQQSEPGRINVSIETCQLAKEKVAFTYRGKIAAKNKGPMDMYFVEGLKMVV